MTEAQMVGRREYRERGQLLQITYREVSFQHRYIHEILNWDHQTFEGGDKDSSLMEALPTTLVSPPNDGNGPRRTTGGDAGVASSDGAQATSGASIGGSLFTGSLDSMPTFE